MNPTELLAWLETRPMLANLAGLSLIAIFAVMADFIARRIIVTTVHRFVQNTAFTWDDALHKKGVFARLARLAPAVVAYYGVTLFPGLHEHVVFVVQRAAATWMVVTIILAINGVLRTVNELYAETPGAKHRPIKGYIQIAQLVLFLIGFVITVGTLLDRSPWVFVSGVGAMTAILMLVFKDTILSLVASVQLTSNDMIRVGDWIEVPDQNADGDVIDIALHTVKVQNWDRTVTTIPTYTLISQGFKNWRTMPLSGGRRIMRPVFIDMGTIRHLTAEEIERFSRFVLLRDYIAEKKKELAEYNAIHATDPDCIANARRLTNVGTFRAYVANYLRHHPGINQNLTLMVRQRDPGPHGLPIQIYAFTNRTDWVPYEAIQSDVFDHILAIAPEFGLRIYQSPSGTDLREAVAQLGQAMPSMLER
jgi:miniconductance mechanosensitive channel